MKNESSEKVNGEIRSKIVRITGEGVESQVVPIEDAKNLAQKMGVDLVQIAMSGDIPVCKLVDYKKFLYKRKMKQKEQQQNSKKNKVKEIRFSYNIGEHDFEFKFKHAENFLKNGDKVRACIMFKGRDIMNADAGRVVLLRLADSLNNVGKAEGLPKLDGKKMTIDINPL